MITNNYTQTCNTFIFYTLGRIVIFFYYFNKVDHNNETIIQFDIMGQSHNNEIIMKKFLLEKRDRACLIPVVEEHSIVESGRYNGIRLF